METRLCGLKGIASRSENKTRAFLKSKNIDSFFYSSFITNFTVIGYIIF
jgi:hypothetical protein